MDEQPKISCLLLGAGFSRRMGQPKLALPFRGATVLETSLRAIAEVPFAERILVTQDDAAVPTNVRSLAIGAEAAEGMHRSIRRGLEALAPCDAVCIALADQPLLQPQDYRALLAAWSPSKDLVYPTRNGQRGNPSLIGAAHFAEIFAQPDDDRGCHYLFQRHPERVYAWPASSENFFRDLDDWETYQACKSS